MEKKTLEFVVEDAKAVKSDGINVAEISGYASVTENLDLGRDRIKKGAFRKSLSNNGGKIVVLVDHDYKMGSIVGETTTAREDDNGLYVDFQLNLDTQAGAETYSRLKHAQSVGRKTGMSIGYTISDYEYKTVKGVEERHLKEVDVMEYSLVTFPMNTSATVTTVKSILESGDAEAIAFKKRSIESLLRDASGCSEKEAKAGVSAIFSKRDAENAEQKAKAQDEAFSAEKFAELNTLIKGE